MQLSSVSTTLSRSSFSRDKGQVIRQSPRRVIRIRVREDRGRGCFVSQHHRDQMIDAVESEPSFENLRAVVQRLLDEGMSTDVLLDDLSQIRGLVTEPQAETVLDVMDLLVGWCAPEARLKPRGEGL